MTAARSPAVLAAALAIFSACGCGKEAYKSTLHAEKAPMDDALPVFQLRQTYMFQISLLGATPELRRIQFRTFERRLRWALQAEGITLAPLSMDNRACALTLPLQGDGGARPLTLHARWDLPDLMDEASPFVQFVIEFASLPVFLLSDDKAVGETARAACRKVTLAAKASVVQGESQYDGPA